MIEMIREELQFIITSHWTSYVTKTRFVVLKIIPIGTIPHTQTRSSDRRSGHLSLTTHRPGTSQDRGLFSLLVRVVLLVCPLQLGNTCYSMDPKLRSTFKVDT